MSLDIHIEKKLKEFTLKSTLYFKENRTALLGASGSGKSMILKCISGIETPDKGYIKVNGRTLFDSEQKINLKPQERRVGYLFQNYALFPNFTVRKNISCVLKDKKNRERVEQLLTLFDLETIADHYAEQLSGGQQQRVALARLLASEPEILLLDEPFSALDTFLREKVEIEMKAFLSNYHGDVVLVTHNRNEAYRLCDHLVILDKGVTIEKGSLKEVFEQPSYIATAKLTGCKNFSAIDRLTDKQAYATDWGITLTTDQEIPDDITHIGIRAHSFFEADEYTNKNVFNVTILDSTETPFEWRFLCSVQAGKEPIWWKVDKKNNQDHFSGSLAVLPSDIQLLKHN